MPYYYVLITGFVVMLLVLFLTVFSTERKDMRIYAKLADGDIWFASAALGFTAGLLSFFVGLVINTMWQIALFWLACTALISFGLTYFCPVGKQDLLTEWRTDVEVWKLSAWIAAWLTILLVMATFIVTSVS